MYSSGQADGWREANSRAILTTIASKGPHSRVELAQKLDLSQASVSRLAEALLSIGLLEEGRKVASNIGRKRTLLELNSAAAVVVGISIRSQTVRVMLADLKGNVLESLKVPREREKLEHLVAQIKALVTNLLSSGPAARLGAVVVGIAGAWDATRERVYAAPNLPYLENSNFLAALRSSLSSLVPAEGVALDNDINYAALGEFAYGAAKGCTSFFYLNLGSGVGGGAVVDGQLYRGFQGFAGEIGLLPICSEGTFCTLESLLSRTALADRARSLGLGDEAVDLLDAARAGHGAASEVVRNLGSQLGVALCSVVTLLNPQKIVIGGSIGPYSDLFIPPVRQSLENYLPILPTLVGTTLSGDSALRGAVSQGLTLAREVIVARDLK